MSPVPTTQAHPNLSSIDGIIQNEEQRMTIYLL